MTTRAYRFGAVAPPRPVSPWDGVLVVDKPAGVTSHDVVDRIRRAFRLDKVGHGGTLDPQATGVLIILLGKGTKLSDRFIGSDKVYQGVLRLGITTDSHDGDGEVLREADYSAVTQEQVEAEMRRRTGDLMHTPPMVSAVKLGGVPLYKRARKRETVERQPRLIHVYEFRLLRFAPPEVEFRIRCTKGTYVRQLCHEIGEAVGCGAYLAQLRRLASGDITIAQATPLAELLRLTPEALQAKVLPLRTLSLGQDG